MSLQPWHEPNPTPAQHERWLQVYEPMIDLAQRLAASPFVAQEMRGDAGAVFSIILAGHGLGLDPVTSLQSISLIKGKPYIDTEVYLGRAYRAGHSIHWGDCTDKRATVRVIRGDGLGSVEVTYTLAQAQLAGYANKDNWRRMPGEMLKARAVRSALKMVAPDLLLGIEMADLDQDTTTPQAAGTVVMRLPQPVDNAAPQTLENGHETVTSVEKSSETDEKLSENLHENSSENKPQPDLITPPQMRKISVQIRELEQAEGRKLDQAERRTVIAGLAGLEHLETAKHLTKQQASDVIEALDRALADKPGDTQPAPQE